MGLLTLEVLGERRLIVDYRLHEIARYGSRETISECDRSAAAKVITTSAAPSEKIDRFLGQRQLKHEQPHMRLQEGWPSKPEVCVSPSPGFLDLDSGSRYSVSKAGQEPPG